MLNNGQTNAWCNHWCNHLLNDWLSVDIFAIAGSWALTSICSLTSTELPLTTAEPRAEPLGLAQVICKVVVPCWYSKSFPDTATELSRGFPVGDKRWWSKRNVSNGSGALSSSGLSSSDGDEWPGAPGHDAGDKAERAAAHGDDESDGIEEKKTNNWLFNNSYRLWQNFN